MKRLKSFEELEFLLPEKEKNEYYEWKKKKEFLKIWPTFLRTKDRVLPYLPKWMKNKEGFEASELFDYNNTCCGFTNVWNHHVKVPLNDEYDVEFFVLDCPDDKEFLPKVLPKVVKVYTDLQKVYRAYRHPMSVVSMMTDDFGMIIPARFYSEAFSESSNRDFFGGKTDNPLPISYLLKDMLSFRVISSINAAKNYFREYASTLDEKDAAELERWVEQYLKHLFEFRDNASTVLGKSTKKPYYIDPVWGGLDIYMGESRYWGRELCIKIDLDEDVRHLEDLRKVRFLIDNIINETFCEAFAFAVKKRGAELTPCNHVTLGSEYCVAVNEQEAA